MSSQSVRILYFVPDWPASASGVLHSTVLAEAKYLQRNGFDCFFIGTDITDEKASAAAKHIEETYGISAKVFGCYSIRFRAISTILQARKVARLSREIINNYRPTHVWTDSCIQSVIGRQIAREQGAISVYDVQAALAEEVALRRGRGIRYLLSRWKEKRELKKSDRLGGVSYKLKQWVKDYVGRDDMIVVPSCVDVEKFCFNEESRNRIRQECGFAENETIICYSGGLSKWQRVPSILNVCGQISKIRKNFKFLFLTQQTEQLQQMIQKSALPIEYCTIRSCIYQEIPQYLSAADAGIVMRDNIVVNNVASPIKIGEYLACGLAVILTKGIGDYSEMVSKAGVGIVLDEDGDPAKQAVRFIEEPGFSTLRDKAIDYAHANVSWHSHLDALRQLFRIES